MVALASVKPTAVMVVPSAGPPTVLMTTAGNSAVLLLPCVFTMLRLSDRDPSLLREPCVLYACKQSQPCRLSRSSEHVSMHAPWQAAFAAEEAVPSFLVPLPCQRQSFRRSGGPPP